jgi:hypothetical protein
MVKCYNSESQYISECIILLLPMCSGHEEANQKQVISVLYDYQRLDSD